MSLSACSGGGGGSDDGGVTLGEVTDEFERLIAFEGDADPIATADIPTVGDASFVGAVIFDVEGTPETQGLTGTANVDVDYAGNTVTGSLGDFLYVADSTADRDTILPEVSGTLQLSNGAVLRGGGIDDPQLGANFSGTLSADVDMFGIAANTDIEIDGGFDAFFADGGFVGELDGTLTPDGGAATEIDGSIIAEEQ